MEIEIGWEKKIRKCFVVVDIVCFFVGIVSCNLIKFVKYGC